MLILWDREDFTPLKVSFDDKLPGTQQSVANARGLVRKTPPDVHPVPGARAGNVPAPSL